MHYQEGNIILVKFFHQILFEAAEAVMCYDQNGQVDRFEGIQGACHAFQSEVAGIVDTSGIYQDCRADAGDFHGLAYRVGGSSRRIGDDGDVLICQGIDKGAFPVVSPAEDTDMRFSVSPFRHILIDLCAKIVKKIVELLSC
jgi:hypothetical protein